MAKRRAKIPVEIKTHREALEWAGKLHTLRESIAETKLLESPATDALREWMMAHDREPLRPGEGVPDLVLKPSTSWNFDLPRMARDDPAMLLRLAEFGCLKLLKTDADRLAAKSLITGYMAYGIEGSGTPSLRFEGESDD